MIPRMKRPPGSRVCGVFGVSKGKTLQDREFSEFSGAFQGKDILEQTYLESLPTPLRIPRPQLPATAIVQRPEDVNPPDQVLRILIPRPQTRIQNQFSLLQIYIGVPRHARYGIGPYRRL
jgi:hypothetical protein